MLPSALPYQVLLEPLLGRGEMEAGILWWRRDLHPVVLTFLHRDPVLGRLHNGYFKIHKMEELHQAKRPCVLSLPH